MDDKEKILTLHPQGKKGVNIMKHKYDVIYDFIAKELKDGKLRTFESLSDQAVRELTASFDGKVMWYFVTVKLDMEARGIIERVPKTSPHQIRLRT
ncbi:hypothetical protein [Imperialibacter roseus]|uniref:Uncharacterized protein n=1 Tax=Imperialibacter roseus TaxID=1324217 RepID=A0ABZ0J0R3_9BACT|nr:hypothetical protein [Imperialibacter roseus]WOK09532.1 hypothetical protein RT717_12870 [Imperialibacter roseus]|tara:strand:- start:45622 stop:45909 length:288 start_codon:yes stop_codon:yes gene_type:complete